MASRGLLVLLALLAIAPAAAAQARAPVLDVQVAFPGEPLLPYVDAPGFPALDDVAVSLPFNVTYTVPPGHVAVTATAIQMRQVEVPFWLTVVGFSPPSFLVPGPRGPALEATSWRFEGNVTLYAKATAPALTPAAVTFEASARPEPRIDLPVGAANVAATAQAQGMVSARPYVVLDVAVANTTLALPPLGEATVQLLVANRGNRAALAAVDVVHAEEGLEARVERPPPLLRPNPLAFRIDDERRPVDVRITHGSGDGGEVLLRVRDALGTDGALVQEDVVRLHVGLLRGAAQPPTWPLAVLAGAAVAALLVRRS